MSAAMAARSVVLRAGMLDPAHTAAPAWVVRSKERWWLLSTGMPALVCAVEERRRAAAAVCHQTKLMLCLNWLDKHTW